MKEELFRKKSIETVKSPENLDDYIRVTNPGVWLLLVGILLLLAGACVWGIFGHMDSTAPAAVRVENGIAVCYIAEGDLASVQTGMTVAFADFEARIAQISETGELGYTCRLTADSALTDGFYEGKVIVQRFRPLSFVLN